MLKAKDFREKAREALKGKWKPAIVAGLISGILGANILYQGYYGSSASSTTEGSISDFSIQIIITTILIVAAISALCILVGSIVGLGYAKFNLALFENEKVSFKMIFSEKSRYKDCFKLFLLQFIFVGVGSLFLVVPGIIAFYANIMGAYIMLENPELTAREALAKSREMMKGNKWRLFCLSFSFIGWDILAALTLGIGNLFLCPYVEAAGAAFYKELKK